MTEHDKPRPNPGMMPSRPHDWLTRSIPQRREQGTTSGASRPEGTPLADIVRPFQEIVILRFGIAAESLLVDEAMILEYKYGLSRPTDPPTRGLWVVRDRTLGVIPRNANKVQTHLPRQTEDEGTFGSVFMRVSDNRPTFYVGERYSVTFVEGDRSEGIFSIDSTEEIRTRFVPPQQDNIAFLEALRGGTV